MNYELKKHKKSDNIKWIVVYVLILALITGMLATFTSGFKNWDVKTWFGEDTKQTEPDSETPQDSVGMLVNNAAENGLRLTTTQLTAEQYANYGVSPLAETACTVNATVKPANADNKSVDWSVAWVNASSEWASDKTVTEYVTVTPVSDGALTATVACLQAFGEQISLICTSRDNTSIQASTTVDYRSRTTGVSLYYKLDEWDDERLFDELYVDVYSDTFFAGVPYTFIPRGIFSAGTILDYEFSYTVSISFSEAFYNYCAYFHGNDDFSLCDGTFATYFGDGSDFRTVANIDISKPFSLTRESLIELELTRPISNESRFSDAELSADLFIHLMKSYPKDREMLEFKVTLDCPYFEYRSSVPFLRFCDVSELLVHVEDMTLDGGELIF